MMIESMCSGRETAGKYCEKALKSGKRELDPEIFCSRGGITSRHTCGATVLETRCLVLTTALPSEGISGSFCYKT